MYMKNDCRIPKKVKVGSIIYTVKFPYVFSEDDDSLGMHDYNTSTIKIVNLYKGNFIHPNRIKQIFLHELVHAVDCNYCGNILSEVEVDSISMGMYYTLSKNNLLLNEEEKLPKVIDINNFKFKVLYPYAHKDLNTNLMASSKLYELKMCLRGVGDSGEMYDLNRVKQYLMLLIICAVCDLYCLSFIELGLNKKDDFDKGDVDLGELFARGWYQVIKDNKINELMMKYGN